MKLPDQAAKDQILAAGIRKQGDKKDIYQIAKKLLSAGLLDLEIDAT